MQQPTQITVRNMRRSARLTASIQELAQKLESHHSGIQHCRVAVEAETERPRQGRVYRVSVNLRIPDRDIVANHHQDENVHVALREAFDAVERQLSEQESALRERRTAAPRRSS